MPKKQRFSLAVAVNQGFCEMFRKLDISFCANILHTHTYGKYADPSKSTAAFNY